jgi:hypothetical protein
LKRFPAYEPHCSQLYKMMTGQYSVLDFNLSVSGPVTQSAAGPNMSSVIIPFHCQYAELTGTHTGQAVAKEVVIDPVRAIAI